MLRKPLWVWMPGQAAPTMAGTLTHTPSGYSLAYERDFIESGISIDPVAMRLGPRPISAPHLPGVIADAKPSGYGQDRINAKHGRDLSDMELLEAGAGDGVGAIAVCEDIGRKQNGTTPNLHDLVAAVARLDEHAPASRAIRSVNADLETSAGGERPKITVNHEGRLWLAKMQDRGDRPGMPALEFVAMSLASECGITTPAVDLHTIGSHQVFMVDRFDREDDPARPCRRLFASAHTVLRLAPASVRGDPRRSYLDFAHEAHRWSNITHGPTGDRFELFKRMAFNALVGNVDDHPRNHGLLMVDGSWRLSPAFDITPIQLVPPPGQDPWPVLSMAVALNGSTVASPENLLSAALTFGIDAQAAGEYLRRTSAHVANSWEQRLRQALPPVSPPADVERIVASARGAFAMSEFIVQHPATLDASIDAAAQAARAPRRRRHF
ncbi:type II toxin-antitoxin system HipA family toxin [Aquabacterium parvum]|uniref:type II toxin-antitoxin system HipA family toxin n=1 Tax=Aquabacterium parvum TaxID=70584 RepID=UPI0009F8A6FE|nr:type II toxin-antitoxin system HipA family toxin [Aquabacterium parvum]MBU0916811.1 type II toxin-antitoxin system HipA family toxin [Gammaproteobacteria bacterium]